MHTQTVKITVPAFSGEGSIAATERWLDNFISTSDVNAALMATGSLPLAATDYWRVNRIRATDAYGYATVTVLRNPDA